MCAHPNMVDYEKTYTAFEENIPEYYNFSEQVIDRWARDPKKLAMLWLDDHGRTIRKTFQEISQRSQKCANALANLGIKKGDRVLLMLSRQIAWWEVMAACIRMGVVVIPSITMLTLKDIWFRINQTKACCLITEPQIAARLGDLADQCPSINHRIVVEKPYENWLFYEDMVTAARPKFDRASTMSSDHCLIYFTSTTEGATRMVLHTHASSAIAHEITGRYWLDLKEDDLHWNLSDTGWAKTAWSSFFGPWHMGAAIFIHHSADIDPDKILDHLSSYPITTLCATPTIYRMLVLRNLQQYRFPFLRHCVGAGEPLNPEIIEIWKNDTGCIICDGYGQTETGLLVANFPCLEERLGAMGKAVPGVELAIIDDEGEILAPGVEGNIAIKIAPRKPLGFFAGYGGDRHEAHQSNIHNEWYLTSDRAYVDADGYFWFVGRADDVILSAGYRINPIEVERVLMGHPAIFEAAVVSSPDDTRGQVVKAFAVIAEGYQASRELIEELQDYVKSMILPYKYPRLIQFVPELPKTFSGKIRRVDLRQFEWRSKKEAAKKGVTDPELKF